MKDYGTYKGESPGKAITRGLVWQRHKQLLGPAFTSSPHVFLASRIAGDIKALRDMGVPAANVWAVEKDREQYQQLFERRRKEGFRLFTEKIETTMTGHRDAGVRSVYLDYCGNIHGTANTTRRVIALLPKGSVLSITLFLGREHHPIPKDRETALLTQLRDNTAHPVTLVQSIYYHSYSSETMGSPMGTWTFQIGPSTVPAVRLDLRGHSTGETRRLAETPAEVERLWQAVPGPSGVDPNMDKKTLQAETAQIKQALTRLRPLFPAGTPDLDIIAGVLRNGECNPKTVGKYARSRKRFSTADVMQHFQADKSRVAASLATLKRDGVIETIERRNGFTVFAWVG